MLASRTDSMLTRLASYAVAVLMAMARRDEAVRAVSQGDG